MCISSKHIRYFQCYHNLRTNTLTYYHGLRWSDQVWIQYTLFKSKVICIQELNIFLEKQSQGHSLRGNSSNKNPRSLIPVFSLETCFFNNLFFPSDLSKKSILWLCPLLLFHQSSSILTSTGSKVQQFSIWIILPHALHWHHKKINLLRALTKVSKSTL